MSLCVHAIDYQIGQQSILQNMTLCLEPGDMLMVLGQNGVGKSSLLNILAGCPSPSAGFVSLEEKKLGVWEWEQIACRRSVLTQFQTAGSGFSVEQVVRLGAAPYENKRNDRRHGQRIEQVLAEVLGDLELTHLRQHYYSELSGGECQRTHLARVFLQALLGLDEHAVYLLLDEAVANLDIQYQRLLLEKLQSITNLGAGVLMVTHDLNHALRYASKVLLMQAGGLYECGMPQELMTTDKLSTVFGVELSLVNDAQGRPYIIVD